MRLTPIIAMVRKDLQLFFVDRKAAALTFAVPIVIASFFGFLFRGASDGSGPTRIAVMVADLDGGVISQSIVAAISADSALRVMPTTADSARDAVRLGKVSVSVVIPPGFGDAAGLAFFNGENKPELELLYDPSRNAELGMVRGMLMGDVIQAVSKEVFAGARGGVLAEQSMARLDSSNLPAEQKRRLVEVLTATRNLELGNAQAGTSLRPPGMTTPYTVRQTAAMANPNANYNSFAHSFGGMGIQFLLMAAIDLGIGVLLERQRGLWNRLRSAPISKAALLGGKAISGTLISLTTLLVSFSFAMIMYKVRIHGSVPGFLGIAAATAFMASTFGLLVAAVGRTPNTARRAAIFATLVMVMLGGAWVPSFFFPPWMQEATKVFPTRWAVNGLDDMTWRGVGWGGAVMPIMILLGFAAAFGAAAAWQFRWEE